MSFQFTSALMLSIVCLITPACVTGTAETPDMNVVFANELNRSAEEGNATANDLRKLVEAGNATAQNRLGLLYHDGQGVPQSYDQAKHWFTKAAEQGHAGAQVNLGTIYLVGHGFYQSASWRCSGFARPQSKTMRWLLRNLGPCMHGGRESPGTLSRLTCGTTWRKRMEKKEAPIFVMRSPSR